MREVLRWLQGLGVAALFGIYDYLTTVQATGTVVLKSLLLAAVVRGLGYAVARWGPARVGVLLLLVLPFAPACQPAEARPVHPPRARLTLASVGDTARLYGSWSSVGGATGYRATVTVSASNGTWTGLPVNQATVARTIAVIATSATADSATFVLCVRATNATDTSAVGCSGPAVWRRRLTPPVVSIDSITALLLYPDTLTMYLGTTAQLCGFPQFANGAVALRAQDAAACDATYRFLFGATTIALVSSAQQQIADRLCYEWQSSNPVVASIAPEICPTGSRRLRIPLAPHVRGTVT